VRQSWDQGALLKQLDIIGRSGRNWPIRDSSDQIRLIAKSAEATPVTSAPAATTATTVPAPSNEAAAPSSRVPLRSRGNSANAPREHHDFFPGGAADPAPWDVVSPYAGSRPRQRDFAEILGDSPSGEHDATPRAPVISPYAGTRPRQRSFTDILGEQDEEEAPPSPSRGRERSQSPSKAVAPKIGAGKNYHPSRLFEADENAPLDPNTPEHLKAKASERMRKPHPHKYEHFHFADGSDPQDAPKAGVEFQNLPRTKHNNQWTFDDFSTPAKPAARPQRAQEVRHWSNEDNPVEETPIKKPVAVKPRRDAETHFEFRDDGPPNPDKNAGTRPRGASHNDNMGLYDNRLHAEDGAAPEAGAPARALGNITNLKDRSKIFDAHFTMTDDSPHHNEGAKPAASEDRMKVVKMMESNWGSYDDSPAAHKENQPGGAVPGTGAGGPAEQKNQGIHIVGDGMGGKKGAGGRGWGIGDDGDGETHATAAVPGKKQGQQQKTGGNFWDF